MESWNSQGRRLSPLASRLSPRGGGLGPLRQLRMRLLPGGPMQAGRCLLRVPAALGFPQTISLKHRTSHGAGLKRSVSPFRCLKPKSPVVGDLTHMKQADAQVFR